MVVTLNFGSKVTDVDFDSRIQEYENKKEKKKRKCLRQVPLKKIMEFGMLFRVFFTFFFFFAEESHNISSHPIKIEGRESCFGHYEGKKRKKKVGCHSDIYRPICFKVEIMRDNTKL